MNVLQIIRPTRLRSKRNRPRRRARRHHPQRLQRAPPPRRSLNIRTHRIRGRPLPSRAHESRDDQRRLARRSQRFKLFRQPLSFIRRHRLPRRRPRVLVRPGRSRATFVLLPRVPRVVRAPSRVAPPSFRRARV